MTVLVLCCSLLAAQAQVPPEAEAALKQIGSRTPAEREMGLHELARLGAADQIPSVLPKLDDPADTVRAAAARTCGDLGARKAIPRLTDMLGDEKPRCRAAAAEALATLQVQKAGPMLLELLDDPEVEVRRAAALAAGEVSCADAKDKLVSLLGDPEDMIRAHAVVSLAKLGATGQKQRFIELLDDTGACTPMKAAAALGTFRATEAAAKIRQLADAITQPARKLNCRIALAAMGQDDAAQVFGELDAQVTKMENSYAPEQARLQIEFLERLSTDQARARIKELAESKCWAFRREARRALGMQWQSGSAAPDAPSVRWIVLAAGLILIALMLVYLKLSGRDKG